MPLRKPTAPPNGAYQMPAYAALQVLDKSMKAVGAEPEKGGELYARPHV